MKKGHASYLMLVYGLAILVVTLLLAALMFSARNPFSGKEEIRVNSDVEVDLLNYVRTPLGIDGQSFTMADLIVYSYYKKDFSKVEEYTKNLLNPVYKDMCSYTITYFTPDFDFHVVNNINDIGKDIDTAEISILGLNEEVINVMVTQIC